MHVMDTQFSHGDPDILPIHIEARTKCISCEAGFFALCIHVMNIPFRLEILTFYLIHIEARPFHDEQIFHDVQIFNDCLLYTSPSPRDPTSSRMPSSA